MSTIYNELYKIVMLVNPNINIDVDNDTNVDHGRN